MRSRAVNHRYYYIIQDEETNHVDGRDSYNLLVYCMFISWSTKTPEVCD